MIRTSRLDLVPATIDLLRAELEGRDVLSRGLAAIVPPDWPPELYDRSAVEWTLGHLEADSQHAGWLLYYFVLRGEDGGPGTAVGCGGFKGGPSGGSVEVGYSILEGFRRRGFASEAVEGLVRYALAQDGVHRVVAETMPELEPSIRVLERCGFARARDEEDAVVIRFVRMAEPARGSSSEDPGTG
jgi:[ribosomal protein S5]-alanine N-acetyltransferase